jgi:Fe2+ transport system protein B
MRYRGFEPVDVAIVSGALLTVFGATLLWVATQGSFQMTTSMQPNTEIDKTTLEEEMGKNVVTASLIEDKHSKEIARAARKLNAETMAAEHVNSSGNETIQHVINDYKEQARSKAARVEFVKGQSIVNATLRATRTQRIPEEQWKELNQRAITTAANEGNRIERAFRANAPETLNSALESEAQAHTAAWQRSQEEAGAAIVKTTLVEQEHERASASVQEQIGSLVSRAAASDML